MLYSTPYKIAVKKQPKSVHVKFHKESSLTSAKQAQL